MLFRFYIPLESDKEPGFWYADFYLEVPDDERQKSFHLKLSHVRAQVVAAIERGQSVDFWDQVLRSLDSIDPAGMPFYLNSATLVDNYMVINTKFMNHKQLLHITRVDTRILRTFD